MLCKAEQNKPEGWLAHLHEGWTVYLAVELLSTPD